MPGGGDPRQWPTTPVSGQVDLGGQAATRASQCIPAGSAGPILVIRPRPLCPTAPARRPPRGCQRAHRAGHRRRADGHGPPRSRPRPSSPGLRPDRHHDAAHPGSAPRCRPGPAAMAVVHRLPMPVLRRHIPPRHTTTGPPEHPPAGDRPTGHHGVDAGPAATAPAGPTPPQSDHDDPAPERSTPPHPK